jgi:cathepsin L
MVDNQNYGYACMDQQCRTMPGQYFAETWGYVAQDGGDPSIDDLKRAVFTNGPVVAAMTATDLFTGYTGGVFNELPNSTGQVNHAILIIGWDDARSAWRIKNSWGAWGEAGFAWVAYGANHIGFGAAWVRMRAQ